MKKLIFVTMMIIFGFHAVKSQQTNSFKEIGLYFSDLKFDNFGFIFKTGNDKLVYRFTALSLGIGNNQNDLYNHTLNQSSNTERFSYNFGLNFGIEKPVVISNKLNFYYGTQLQLGLNAEKTSNFIYSRMPGSVSNSNTNSNYYSIGLGFIVGSTIGINKNVYLSAELIPNITYGYNRSTTTSNSDTTNSGIGFNANNNWASLILGYRF